MAMPVRCYHLCVYLVHDYHPVRRALVYLYFLHGYPWIDILSLVFPLCVWLSPSKDVIISVSTLCIVIPQ